MAELHENVIEWYTGEKTASITVWNGRMKNRILRLAEKHPDEVEIIAENEDGSLFAHIPLRWIKITKPRELSEEQRQASAENLRKNRLK